MEEMPSSLYEEDLLFLEEYEQQLPWRTHFWVPGKLYFHQ